MNLILLFKDDFIEGTDRARLKDRRLRHVLAVHRAAVGDELCVGLAGDRIGTGTVTFLTEEVLEMDIHLHRDPPVALPVTLILALPRPKVLKRILSSVGAMGVKSIFLINSYRVEKSFWQSPVLSEEDLKKQLVLGLEQSRDTIIPEVTLKPLFKPFVEDELPGIIKNTFPVVAHPEAPELCPRGVDRPVTVAVGPEGGFIPYEVKKLITSGFHAFNLGERILNVETAVPFLLSRLL